MIHTIVMKITTRGIEENYNNNNNNKNWWPIKLNRIHKKTTWIFLQRLNVKS